MDLELLAAIGDMLDKKLDDKLDERFAIQDQRFDDKLDERFAAQDKKIDEKFAAQDKKIDGLQRQNDIIFNKVNEISDDVKKLSEGQFQLRSEVAELRRGQERTEARLDLAEAEAKVIGAMCSDHETRLRILEQR